MPWCMVPQLTKVTGKEKEGFWKRTDRNAQGKELGRDQRFIETLHVSYRHSTLRCSSTQHTWYWCSQRLLDFLKCKENLPMAQEEPRKNTAKSVKTIQIKPESSYIAGTSDTRFSAFMEEPYPYPEPTAVPWLQRTSLQDIPAFDTVYNLSKNSFYVTLQTS